MSSGSSMYTRNNVSSTRRPLLCFHGRKPVLRISLTKDNPGRRFWGCVYYNVQQECSFFRWADPDSEYFAIELGKMKKVIETLKLRAVVAERHLTLSVVLEMIGWILVIFLWLHFSGSCSC
ncbi:hypothetical protein PIB30_021992 [Stylosanthes scabra]|uniref:GRF-type domain-containing protein n=1 Tax=Stylosanthes scabra TaxID=79078 RepID=A0ABU6W945_9FABA|nr:hypothetical protein [Stylosanthes scabra]